jgi:low temperature requirement protein LtrA
MATEPHSPKPLGPAVREWFLRAPRPHGELIEDRSVGYLELFYDLVFVVFVSRITGTLAEDITARGVLDYCVLFSMLWLTWFNGSLYHELHGREDGRARSLMFTQMLLLALLAVYAGRATAEDGSSFAWVLTALLAIQTYQWLTVYRIDHPRFRRAAGRYLLGSAVAIVVSATAALLDDADARMVAWGALLAVAVFGFSALQLLAPRDTSAFHATESMVERFALFVIIVLGEVVVGVVGGLSDGARDGRTVATGLLALAIGFGFWWTYFDLIGARLPRDTSRSLVGWLVGHLPVTLAIAGAGAGMIGLVHHAHDARTPSANAWLIAGAVAAALAGTALLARTLDDHDRLSHVYRPVSRGLLAGAVAALVAGALHPAPWLLALLLVVVMSAVWWLAFTRVIAGGGQK